MTAGEVFLAVVGLAVAACLLGTLAFVGIKLRALELRVAGLVNASLTSGGAAREAEHTHVEDPTELHPRFQVGQHLALAGLQTGDSENRWTVVVGVSKSCDTCQRVLADLPEILPYLQELDVVIATSDPILTQPDVPMLVVTPSELAGTPFTLMVDIDGTIQGAAQVNNGAEVLEFVSEGQGMGFGPGLTPVDGVLPVAATSGHGHGHHH